MADLTAADFAQEGYFYQMGVPPVRVDILMGIPGVVFAEAWPRRMEVDFAGLLVPFIGREDLIAAKRAAGRPQDLLDVEQLTRPEGKPPNAVQSNEWCVFAVRWSATFHRSWWCSAWDGADGQGRS